MRRILLTGAIAGALVLGACGGDDGSVDVATTDAETTTTTAAPTTTTTEAPTTTTMPPTTTTTQPAAPTDEELAELIVLEAGFFGADWDEVPQTDSDFSYATIDGCEFLDDLDDADGHLVEAESPEFSQFDTSIEHDVRVYPNAGIAVDVVLAWAQDPTLECLLERGKRLAQESLDRGELAPYTSVDIDISRFDDVIGEPRITHFEILQTLTSSESQLLFHTDVYFIQAGRFVSGIRVANPGGRWSSTDRLLDAVLFRMGVADETDSS